MARAVAPWTWRRVLRDYGPDDEGLLLALLILATYMDRDGFAFPGQPTWARAARKSVRTLQRYITQARATGWLQIVNAGRTGQGWAFNAYRACVPDGIHVPEQDERMADAIISVFGEVEGHDTAMSVPIPNGHDTAMSVPVTGRHEGDDIRDTKVTTFGEKGDDISSKKVPTSGCRTNSRSENSRSENSRLEEAHRASATRTVSEGRSFKTQDPEGRQEKIRKLIAALPLAKDGDLRRMVRGATLEEVRRARGAA